MTPPGKDERGEDTATQAPPWQRVDRSGDPGDGATTQLPAFDDGVEWPGLTDNAAERENDDRMSHTGDLPVVTGVAAERMFGTPHQRSPHPTGSDDDEYPAKERNTVSVASTGAKGKSVPTALRRPGRGPRRASLQVKRIDPWSVLKLSLVLGVALFLVWMVAVGLLYIVLDGMGVWTKLNGTYTSLVSGEGAATPAEPLISAGRVFGIAAIVGAINIVLMSALATVCAFIYNVSADLAGGLEVTLSERE